VPDLVDILKGSQLSDKTIKAYVRIISKFAKTVDGPPKEIHARAFLGRIRDRVSESEYYLTYYALKKLFVDVLNKPFTIDPPDRPSEQYRPVLDFERAKRLIEWAKHEGSKATKFYLSLASTFGFRRAELSMLSERSFDGGYIIVPPLKKGKKRVHKIPEPIEEYVFGFTPKPMSEATMSRFFKGMAKKAGIKIRAKEGWHSIRRLVVTSLSEAGLNYLIIHKFMRWSEGRENRQLAMVARYTRMEDDKVDALVYQNHPLLRLWEEL